MHNNGTSPYSFLCCQQLIIFLSSFGFIFFYKTNIKTKIITFLYYKNPSMDES